MPEISRFHGIIIRMYHDDRHYPHFHAYFGEYSAVFTIDPPALYAGGIPRRQQHIILGWAEVHQRELMDYGAYHVRVCHCGVLKGRSDGN